MVEHWLNRTHSPFVLGISSQPGTFGKLITRQCRFIHDWSAVLTCVGWMRMRNREETKIDPLVDKVFFNDPKMWDQMETNQERFKRESGIILALIEEHFSNTTISLLDVGCGTGGHFPFFLEKEVHCSGIDLNPMMIEYAESKFPDIHLQVQDMRKLDYDQEFELIICMNSTFLYNLTNEDITTTLQGFHNALKPGGLLVIDFSEAVTFLLQRGREDPDKGVTYKIHGPDFQVEVNVKTEVDPVRQISLGERTYTFEDGRVFTEEITYRKLFAQEFRFFLEQTGFIDVEFKLISEDRQLTPARLLTLARTISET